MSQMIDIKKFFMEDLKEFVTFTSYRRGQKQPRMRWKDSEDSG